MERTNGQKDGHDDAGKPERLGDWKEKSEKKSEKNPDKKSEQSKRQPDATARAKPIPFVPCKHGPSNSPDTGVAAATSRPMTPTGSISRQSPRQSPHHARESSPLSSSSPACGSPSSRGSSSPRERTFSGGSSNSGPRRSVVYKPAQPAGPFARASPQVVTTTGFKPVRGATPTGEVDSASRVHTELDSLSSEVATILSRLENVETNVNELIQTTEIESGRAPGIVKLTEFKHRGVESPWQTYEVVKPPNAAVKPAPRAKALLSVGGRSPAATRARVMYQRPTTESTRIGTINTRATRPAEPSTSPGRVTKARRTPSPPRSAFFPAAMAPTVPMAN